MFSQTLGHGNNKNEQDKETDEEGKTRGVSVERNKAGKKKKSADGLNYPNENTVIINNLSLF